MCHLCYKVLLLILRFTLISLISPVLPFYSLFFYMPLLLLFGSSFSCHFSFCFYLLL